MPEEMPIARVRRVKLAPSGQPVKRGNREQRVPQDKQAMPALQANSVILVKRVLQAKEPTLVKWVTPVKLGPKVKEPTRVKEATRDQRVRKVKWVPLVLKANEVIQVKKEMSGPQVPLDLKGLSDHKALKALKALRVKWEQPAQWALKGLAVQSVLKVWKVKKGYPASLDPRALEESQGKTPQIRDPPVIPVTKDSKEPLDQRDNAERRAKLATSVRRAKLAIKAQSVQQAQQVPEEILGRMVKQASPVQTGLAVRKDRLESPVRMESLAKPESLGLLVLEAIAATRATKVQLESKGVKVPRVLEATAVTRVKRAPRAPLVTLVQSVPLAKKPTQATQAVRVKRAFKVASVQQALEATRATRASLEKRARPGLEGRRVLGATQVPLEIPAPRAVPGDKAIAAQQATPDSKGQWDRVALSAYLVRVVLLVKLVPGVIRVQLAEWVL